MSGLVYAVWGVCFLGMGILAKEIADGIADVLLDIKEESELNSKVKNGYAVYVNDRRIHRLRDDFSSYAFDEVLVDDYYKEIHAYVYDN